MIVVVLADNPAGDYHPSFDQDELEEFMNALGGKDTSLISPQGKQGSVPFTTPSGGNTGAGLGLRTTQNSVTATTQTSSTASPGNNALCSGVTIPDQGNEMLY